MRQVTEASDSSSSQLAHVAAVAGRCDVSRRLHEVALADLRLQLAGLLKRYALLAAEVVTLQGQVRSLQEGT
jgi:hypothetical protein